MEENRRGKTTFKGRQSLMEDGLQWKLTFDVRQPLMEDVPQWKTTYNGSQPLMKDDIQWKTASQILFFCDTLLSFFFNLFYAPISLFIEYPVNLFFYETPGILYRPLFIYDIIGLLILFTLIDTTEFNGKYLP